MFKHTTVLLHEAVDGLAIKSDGIYVDCTLGGAGHSKEIVKKLSPEGRLICFDQDMTAIEVAKEQLEGLSCTSDIRTLEFQKLKGRIG